MGCKQRGRRLASWLYVAPRAHLPLSSRFQSVRSDIGIIILDLKHDLRQSRHDRLARDFTQLR
jgi:hypothetical protein